MSVSLRLSRGGTKKRPFYRIVAADVRSPRDGRFIERLGTYNPMKSKDNPERINLNIDRIKYWLSVGAKPTDRVAKFLSLEKIVPKPKVHPQTKQDKPKPKTLEKLKAKEEKAKAKVSAEATPTEEAPTEPTPAEKAPTQTAPTEPTPTEKTKTEAISNEAVVADKNNDESSSNDKIEANQTDKIVSDQEEKK